MQGVITAGVTAQIGHLRNRVMTPVDMAGDPLAQLQCDSIHDVDGIGVISEAGDSMLQKEVSVILQGLLIGGLILSVCL